MSGPRQPDARDAAATLAAVARRLEAVQRVAPPGPDDQLSVVVDIAVVVLDAQAASIALHDAGADRLRFVAAAGPAAGDVVGLEIESALGIAGYAFTTGQPLAIVDVTSDPRFDRRVSEATGYLPRSILATPLVDEQGTVGVLEVLDRHGDGGFSMRDLDVAGALARGATAAVRAGRAERDAAALLRRALIGLARSGDAEGLDGAAIDDLVREAVGPLSDDPDDPTWRLAERIARLRTVDPDIVELAGEWLDAVLRRADRSPGRGPRVGQRR
jgi:GAF domain-containing protein